MKFYHLATILIVGYCEGVGASLAADEVRCGMHLMFGNPGGADQVLCRTGFAVGYSYSHRGPVWVGYSITSSSAFGNHAARRQNDFRSDTDIPEEYRATPGDYEEPVFDQGHMADSAAIDFTVRANSETFLMSNMAPQIPEFNRAAFGFNGAWGALEHKVRSWVKMRGHLYVIAGAIYGDDATVIGNGVAVPTSFYKIIVDVRTLNAIGFLFSSEERNTGGNLANRLKSIDELEALSGLDFLVDLDDELEARIERTTETTVWNTRSGK